MTYYNNVIYSHHAQWCDQEDNFTWNTTAEKDKQCRFPDEILKEYINENECVLVIGRRKATVSKERAARSLNDPLTPFDKVEDISEIFVRDDD